MHADVHLAGREIDKDDRGEIEPLIGAGQVTGGMVPKLRSAAEAVHRGVGRVHICGWVDGATLERQLSESTAPGTVIKE